MNPNYSVALKNLFSSLRSVIAKFGGSMMSVNHIIVSLLSIIALLSGSAYSLSCYACVGSEDCYVITANTRKSTCDTGDNVCQTKYAFGVFSRSCTSDTTAGCQTVTSALGTEFWCTFACTTDLCNTDVPTIYPPSTTASTQSAAPTSTASNARAVLSALAAALLVLWALSRADMK